MNFIRFKSFGNGIKTYYQGFFVVKNRIWVREAYYSTKTYLANPIKIIFINIYFVNIFCWYKFKPSDKPSI